MTEQLCRACSGTVLPPSVGGAKRGTCHCPENLNPEETMSKKPNDTTSAEPVAPEKVEPRAPKPIEFGPDSEVRAAKVGSKLAALIDALAAGATMAQLI